MEELVLTQMQVNILKTMIEAYEKGINVQLALGMAAGKTTVMKIFNEYVRHKKENPDYKVSFSDIGELLTKGGRSVNADKVFIDDSNKKQPIDYKLIPNENGFIYVWGTSTFELSEGDLKIEPLESFKFRCSSYDESGPITQAHTEEIRKRLKK